MPSNMFTSPDPQQLLSRHLLLELAHRQETLARLAEHTHTCPLELTEVLHGKKPLTPLLAHQLTSHWDISPGLLWHWQQDISSHHPALQARAG